MSLPKSIAFFKSIEKNHNFILLHESMMEDIKICVFRVGKNTETEEDANLRFAEFQRLIELKNITKFLRYKLRRDFVVNDYDYRKVITDKNEKLLTAERKLVKFLVDEKIQINIRGEFKTIEEIFKDNQECVEKTFGCYLENNIGSLTISQITHLYCEHDMMNIDHHELYGLLEYEKASMGS